MMTDFMTNYCLLDSETPPSKLGGIFQMYYLITFAHSSPQQADGVSCAAFMNLGFI
jgi:hypothetical protein